MKRIFFLSIICIYSIGLFGQGKLDVVYTQDQLQSDFSLLKKAFIERHPGIAIYMSRDSLEYWFDYYNSQLNKPMTEAEFANVLRPLIEKMRCAHTVVYPSKTYMEALKENGRYVFPLRVQIIDQSLHAFEDWNGDTIIDVGSKILEINGQDSKTVIDLLYSHRASDGLNQTLKKAFIGHYFTAYYRSAFGDVDSFYLACENVEGLPFTQTIPAKFIAKDSTLSLPFPEWYDYNPVMKFTNNRLFQLPEDSSTYILDIARFRPSKATKFYKKVFKYLAEKKAKRLVLDLRGNPGGLIHVGTDLMSYLLNEKVEMVLHRKRGKPSFKAHLNGDFGRFMQRMMLRIQRKVRKDEDHVYYSHKTYLHKKQHFEGELFALTDGGTASTSSIVTSYLKSYRGLISIGEETGGGQAGSQGMSIPFLTLPNSQIRIKLPFYRLTHQIDLAPTGGGIKPDYPIFYTLESLLKGEDLQMKKLISLIKE